MTTKSPGRANARGFFKEKKMIILTGGAGFIGSCFLWKLNREGIEDIIVVDDLDDTGKWKNLAGKRFRDYVQKDDFLRMVEGGKMAAPDAVIHMGACSSTTLTDAGYYIRNNYEYSKKLAKWALSKKAYFMYASSAATYGAGVNGYDDSIEAMPRQRPLNMYGFSKHLFDLWVLDNGLMNKVTGLSAPVRVSGALLPALAASEFTFASASDSV